jgi:valyl-tRNA synthetase
VPWSATLEPIAIGGPVEQLNAQAATLARLAKLGPARIADAPPPGSAQIVVHGQTYAFPLAEHVDVEAEKARLSKSSQAAEKERDSLAARLSNPNFTERAKPEAVEKARFDHESKAAEAERLRAALERLG